MAYGTVNADVIGTSVAGSNLGAGDASLMKNRIINGAMVIDQRNSGASVTPANLAYTLDRWKAEISASSKFSVQQSSTAPTGFNNSLLITSSSAYTVGASDYFAICQPIEGYNVADLGFGTANSKTVTISFWVRSSVTGTYSAVLVNQNDTRVYPFTYTINSANTFEQKSVTIAGDTSGTWLTTNGAGIRVNFYIGLGTNFQGSVNAWNSGTVYGASGTTNLVSTNGATFYITGVQLEVGSSATGFEYVNYQTSLSNCQRYFYKIGGTDTNELLGSGVFQAAGNAEFVINMPVTMRSAPTASYSGTISNFRVSSNASYTPTALSFDIFGLNTLRASATVSGATAGYSCYLKSNTSTAQTINISAEL